MKGGCVKCINLRFSYIEILRMYVVTLVISEVADLSFMIATVMFPELERLTAEVKYFEWLSVL